MKHAAERYSTDNNKSRTIRRQLVRSAIHLQKSVDYLFALRKIVDKQNNMGDMQFLTEAIAFHKQSLAYLNLVSKHRFGKPLDQLVQSYK